MVKLFPIMPLVPVTDPGSQLLLLRVAIPYANALTSH